MMQRFKPRGLLAFVNCARAQHRHLHSPWHEAIRVAWKFGPVR